MADDKQRFRLGDLVPALDKMLSLFDERGQVPSQELTEYSLKAAGGSVQKIAEQIELARRTRGEKKD